MNIKHIVESVYYSKSFDGAIFDGPFRIYFAQYQEQRGLELFHHLIHTYTSYNKDIKRLNRNFKRKVFMFMYPDSVEKNRYQPKGDQNKVFITPFKSDYIIGFNSDTLRRNKRALESYFKFICENWLQQPSNKVQEHFKDDFLIHLD